MSVYMFCTDYSHFFYMMTTLRPPANIYSLLHFPIVFFKEPWTFSLYFVLVNHSRLTYYMIASRELLFASLKISQKIIIPNKIVELKKQSVVLIFLISYTLLTPGFRGCWPEKPGGHHHGEGGEQRPALPPPNLAAASFLASRKEKGYM